MIDGLITAGGISKPNDPLYKLTGTTKKALIPLAGRPMISWVIDAMVGSGMINNLVIVGLTPDDITLPDIPTYFLPSTGRMVENLLVGRDKLVEITPSLKKILLCSSDIPLVTPEIIRGFVGECGDLSGDIYYSIVEESVMEKQYPNSNRTYIPCKGGRYTGGDAFVVRADLQPDNEFMRGIIGSRKNYLKQIQMFGVGFIIRFLARRIPVHQAAAEAARRAGIPDGRVLLTRYAELAMDLDKPNHYNLIKTKLEAREVNSE
ncbi:NTP transferase domain-containing protein [Anaerolineales bacterium HSG6]|nr:NTP transferase domain-containing protein [Anaerolineales bacterium HSG6]MDM8533007.1 NTP transferase domain-containing protein [Anaerolineales bacterium HSG25]